MAKIMLEASQDCLKVLDRQGRLRYMNYNGQRMMEIDDFTSFENQFWWDLWKGNEKETAHRAVTKALEGETFQFCGSCPTAKGTPKWWKITVLPLGNDPTNAPEILVVSQDVTKEHQYQEEIKRIQERAQELENRNIQLEQTNQDLISFNYIASHDLQEPLRKIEMFTQKVLDKGFNKDTFLRIRNTASRMRNLIDAIHSFAMTKNTEVKPEKCDIGEIVAEVKENLQELLDSKGGKLIYTGVETIKGSKVLLTQLVNNLVENSLKYARENISPEVRVSSHSLTSEDIELPAGLSGKNFVEIRIQDNGIGFGAEYSGKIFELFQRLHHKNEYSGYGIGLTICKGIVQKHGGWILAEGKENEGATFRIILPQK